jgi:hypothetical protein
MTIIAQLCLPILEPLRPEHEQRELHAQTIDELTHLKKILPLDAEFASAPMSIELRARPEDEPLLDGRWVRPYSHWQNFSLLNISVDATACIHAIRLAADKSPNKFSDAELDSICQRQAITMLQMEAHYLLLAVNIARPSSLSVVQGYAFLNEHYVEETKSFLAGELVAAVQVSQEKGWPKLIAPSIKETWAWLIASGALVDGVGVGRLGRALSALSHLTASSNLDRSSIELAWVLLGLEALYARGNVGLKEQLLGKTESVLGPRTENKKLFGAVYDFRSRLIHGDVDIPLRFTEFDGADKYEKFHSERYEHEALATAVLIATIQWMIKRKAHSLEFEYAVKSNEADGPCNARIDS